MRMLAICAVLIVTGCDRPTITDQVETGAMADINEYRAGNATSLLARIDDMEFRLRATEDKNLQYEIERDQLKAEIRDMKREIENLKEFIPKQIGSDSM